MNSHAVATAALAITIFSGWTWAQDQDKLLPSEEATKISLSLRRDGRALLITVKNDSRLALTSADLVCELYDSSKPLPKFATNGREWCVSPKDNLDEYFRQGGKCEHPNPYSWSIPEPVLPGKSKEFYFETPNGRLPPVRCASMDLRGRARKLWEF